MSQKRFAVVSAIYNVARYLDDFTSSLDRQTADHDDVQIILVDDGSTDESLEKIEQWSAATDYSVTVLTKPNGGQASARNLGMTAVTAEWVTFTDPDDTLADDYFEVVAANIDAHPQAEMVICHLVDHFEETGEVRDSHPLRFRFRGGDQLVDVDRFPEYVHLSASSAFFRVAQVRDMDLNFDERIRPIFEDGHFIQRYLLSLSKRLVTVVDTAKYFYRRRADNSSSLQNSAADQGRYTTVLEHGYLDLLKQASPQVPLWLQYVVIYDLTWTLRAEEAMFSGTSGVEAPVADRFHELMQQIVEYLTPAAIESFPLIKRSTSQWEALVHGYSGENWRWPSVVIDRFDEQRQLVELRYHFTGDTPQETIRLRGKRVQPFVAKTRHFTYLRRVLLQERILWVAADGTLEIELDGKPTPLTFDWPRPNQFSVRPARIQERRGPRKAASKPKRSRSKVKNSDRHLSRLAKSSLMRRLFSDAWVLMDRDVNANDNAEHLFRYLRKHRRDINAWFVVKKDSPDWTRLRAEGFKRLIPYGSTVWKVLCLNARYIVSSHADRYVYAPFHLSTGSRPQWRFVFLQHGVTKDDISRWLNSKAMAGMVTSTTGEFASIAGDGSPYKFSAKDVALTGFPRHDALASKAATVTPVNRKTIAIMPTWRQFLVGATTGNGNERQLLPEFFESDFYRRWVDLLRSKELKTMAQDHGLRIVFMPHPNLEAYLPEISLPDHIEVTSYAETNVQDELAEAALVVTDYSSIAFDAAVIRRPVVYYQFDRDRVFGGGHLTRPGYFSYEEDGFGPVALDHRDALEAIRETVDHGVDPAPEYLERIERTFVATGGACKRVTAMIEDLDRPVRAKEHIPTPQAPALKYVN